jgi:hypothetical protein
MMPFSGFTIIVKSFGQVVFVPTATNSDKDYVSLELERS